MRCSLNKKALKLRFQCLFLSKWMSGINILEFDAQPNTNIETIAF